MLPERKAAAVTISDPLLDDVTMLISAALMFFSSDAQPQVQAVCGTPFAGGEERDNVAGGGDA